MGSCVHRTDDAVCLSHFSLTLFGDCSSEVPGPAIGGGRGSVISISWDRNVRFGEWERARLAQYCTADARQLGCATGPFFLFLQNARYRITYPQRLALQSAGWGRAQGVSENPTTSSDTVSVQDLVLKGSFGYYLVFHLGGEDCRSSHPTACAAASCKRSCTNRQAGRQAGR